MKGSCANHCESLCYEGHTTHLSLCEELFKAYIALFSLGEVVQHKGVSLGLKHVHSGFSKAS